MQLDLDKKTHRNTPVTSKLPDHFISNQTTVLLYNNKVLNITTPYHIITLKLTHVYTVSWFSACESQLWNNKPEFIYTKMLLSTAIVEYN